MKKKTANKMHLVICEVKLRFCYSFQPKACIMTNVE